MQILEKRWYINCIFHEPPQEKVAGCEICRPLCQNWNAKSSFSMLQYEPSLLNQWRARHGLICHELFNSLVQMTLFVLYLFILERRYSVRKRRTFSANGEELRPDGKCNLLNLHISWRFLNESLPQWWIGRMGNEDLALQFWSPRSPNLKSCDFFLWRFVKDAVYIPSLLKNLNDVRNHITAAVNSVTHGIHYKVWDEFNYRLDVICATGGGILNTCKLPCMYNQM